MKIRLIVCLAVLLLVSGCRGPGTQKADAGGAAASGAPQSTQQTDVSPVSPSVASSPAPSGGEETSSSTASPGKASVSSPSGQPAPKEEVNATLDDIIKELNDLDKLYSQMDNLNESDLN